LATVYSKQFFAVEGLTAGVYSYVPPGYVHVLRDVDVYYNYPGSLTGKFYLVGDNGQTIVSYTFVIASGVSTFQWRGRQVINSVMEIYTDGNAMDVSVSGYELSLP
jgi:hypothetical protein